MNGILLNNACFKALFLIECHPGPTLGSDALPQQYADMHYFCICNDKTVCGTEVNDRSSTD